MEKAEIRVPRMMTPREVAATGVLTEYSIRRGLRDGTVPGVRIGNCWRVNFDALLQMLQGGEREGQ